MVCQGMTSRDELRRKALAQRDGIPTELHEARSHQANEHLRAWLDKSNARYIHCYISFRSELETRELIKSLLRQGRRIVVPVIEELDGRQFMIHTEIHGLDDLAQGHFGLSEPVARSTASLEGLDAVVVPLSAFDRDGNRLGYGKGFYDRFLSELPRSVARVGLAFALQEVEQIPTHSLDQPLDIVITENGVIEMNSHRV
jgi:5-formyltetrahydrofolate cyclo-ligase